MSALPKIPPIQARAVERPRYLGWIHVKRNEPEKWIEINRKLVEWWWHAGEIRLGEAFDKANFERFCRCQFDIERMHYENLKADGFDDPYERRSHDE